MEVEPLLPLRQRERQGQGQGRLVCGGGAIELGSSTDEDVVDVTEEEDLDSLKVADLKERLEAKGLDTKGKKAELLSRLKEAVAAAAAAVSLSSGGSNKRKAAAPPAAEAPPSKAAMKGKGKAKAEPPAPVIGAA